MRTPTTPRRGFTLIEMLVVISLMLILVSVAVVMFPRISESQKVTTGAGQIQQALATARTLALAEKRETGLRLILNGTSVTEMVYVQKPVDFGPPPYNAANPLFGSARVETALNTVLFTGVDLTGGFANPADQPVQRGDYLEIQGGGLPHLIVSVGPGQVVLASPFTYAIPPTRQWRVLSQPRLRGEQPVQLPQNVVIDFDTIPSTTLTYSRNVPQRGTVLEILFSPGGAVVGRGTSGENILLWVRDITKDSPLEGSPLLVTIHPRTGTVAIHPVNTSPGPTEDFWSFTRDGRSSGL